VVVFLVLLGGPFVLAAVSILLTQTRWVNVHWMFVAGLVLAIAFIGVAYLRAAPNYQSSNGVDGEMFLGRWWDPQFTVMLAIIGYVGWALGIAVGLLLRGTLDALHPRKSERLP